MIGNQVSHYKILEELGRGGMGVVYKAEDIKLKRIVALKFLSTELTQNPKAKERFIKEAQTASALDHHHICTIHEIDETDDGQMFICMSYYGGKILTELIEHGPVEVDRSLEIAIQIATGLAKAHDNGIVHRDIKSANIVVTEDNVVKILDFGLAKLTGATKITKTGMAMGTPAYMSPEQVKGKNVGPQSDVWALGIILYEMLSGTLPFRGEDQMSVMYNITHEKPKPLNELRPNLSSEVIAVVQKALEKDPAQRYDTMHSVLEDLQRVRSNLSGEAETVAVNRHEAETVFIPTKDEPSRNDAEPEADIQETQPLTQDTKSSGLPSFKILLPILLALIVGYVGFTNKETITEWFPASEPAASNSKPVEIDYGSLKIDSNPQKAAIILNGRDTGLTTPATLDSLTPGTHAVQVQLAGYQPAQNQIDIEAGSPTEWLATLDKAVGKLEVRSEPSGADILIDNQRTGEVTPATFREIEIGSHEIVLLRDGYQEFRTAVELAPNSPVEISPRLTRLPDGSVSQSQKSKLTVSAVTRQASGLMPAVAEVFVNGEHMQQTPVNLELSSGTYKITAKLFGYEPLEKTVTLKNGQDEKIRFEFAK